MNSTAEELRSSRVPPTLRTGLSNFRVARGCRSFHHCVRAACYTTLLSPTSCARIPRWAGPLDWHPALRSSGSLGEEEGAQRLQWHQLDTNGGGWGETAPRQESGGCRLTLQGATHTHWTALSSKPREREMGPDNFPSLNNATRLQKLLFYHSCLIL